MTRLPLFQGINIPSGLQAQIPAQITILQSTMSAEDYDTYIRNLLHTIESLMSWIISIAGPPEIVAAETSTTGTKIYIQFDKNMNDPSGKESQFSVSVNGVSDTVSALSYYGAGYQWFELTLATLTVIFGDIVTISYTPGDIYAQDTTQLKSFTDQAVTNKSTIVPMGLTIPEPSISFSTVLS